MDIYERFIHHVRCTQIFDFFMRYKNQDYKSIPSILREKNDKSLRVYYPIINHVKSRDKLLQNLLNVTYDTSTHGLFKLDPNELNFDYKSAKVNYDKYLENIENGNILSKTLLKEFKPSPFRNYDFLDIDNNFAEMKQKLKDYINVEPSKITLSEMKKLLSHDDLTEESVLVQCKEIEDKINELTNEIFNLLQAKFIELKEEIPEEENESEMEVLFQETKKRQQAFVIDEVVMKSKIKDMLPSSQLTDAEKHVIVDQLYQIHSPNKRPRIS